MAEGALVSCLCVTRNRVALLRRAVQCFRQQTYAPRELLIVYESDDPATRAFVRHLDDSDIRVVEVAAQPRQSLGALRNLAVREARGDFIAQWDDDDWYAPERLQMQMQALAEQQRPACVLLRWLMYDELLHQAWLSQIRPWEGSLLARRDAMPDYADLSKGEDKPALERMLKSSLLVGLDRPELYVYVYHGANTWERAHWDEKMLVGAQRLTDADADRLRKLLHDLPAQN